MTVIQDRIRSLQLPESAWRLLSNEEIGEVRSRMMLFRSEEFCKKIDTYSFVELRPEAVTAMLNSLKIQEPMVLAWWPAFREGFELEWEVFTSRFDDIYIPSAHDIIVTVPKATWMLEISHEEEIRFFVKTLS